MIQLTVVPKHVNKISFDHLYTLKTRNTYMGLHRELVRPDMEVGCTRSALVGFMRRRDADRFKDVLSAEYAQKRVLNRHIQDNRSLKFVTVNANMETTLSPVVIETVPRVFLLSMCIVHGMDILIVDDFSKITEASAWPNQWKMYCYESRLNSEPNPDILSQMFS